MDSIKVLRIHNRELCIYKIIEYHVPLIIAFIVVSGRKVESAAKFESEAAQDKFFQNFGVNNNYDSEMVGALLSAYEAGLMKGEAVTEGGNLKIINPLRNGAANL